MEAIKTKKYVLFLVLIGWISLPSFAEIFRGTCGAVGHDLTWELNTEDSLLVINGTGTVMADVDYRKLDAAPWWEHSACIVRVVMPQTLTHIGDEMFQLCEQLREIHLPDSLQSIGYRAFFYDSALRSVSFPAGLKSVGEYAFTGCGLTALDLSGNDVSLGMRAFSNCDLRTAVLPAGMSELPGYLFSNCHSLQEVQLPAGLCAIGEHAFEGCRSLKSMALPETLVSIGEQAFCRCSSLTDVLLPAGLKSVGNQSFGLCTRLENISSLSSTPPSIVKAGNSQYNLAENLINKAMTCDVALSVPAEALSAYLSAEGWKEFHAINGACSEETSLHGTMIVPQESRVGNGIAAPALTVTIERDSLRISGIVSGFAAANEYLDYKFNAGLLELDFYNFGSFAFGFESYAIDFTIGPIDPAVEKLDVVVTAPYNQKQAFTVDHTGVSPHRCTSCPNAPYYDLQGRPVTHPTSGIYIQNGRKVMVREK